MSYSKLGFKLRAQKVEDEWQVALSDLALARPQSQWHARRMEARWARDADGQLRVSGKADRIVLDNLWPLLAYLPESRGLARVRALGARGTVEGLTFAYAQGRAPRYSVQAQVQNLAFRPIERLPGLSGLSGTLSMTDQGGSWRMAARDARFELPRMFRQPLAAQSIDGTLQWRREPDAWTIAGRGAVLPRCVRVSRHPPAVSPAPIVTVPSVRSPLRAEPLNRGRDDVQSPPTARALLREFDLS